MCQIVHRVFVILMVFVMSPQAAAQFQFHETFDKPLDPGVFNLSGSSGQGDDYSWWLEGGEIHFDFPQGDSGGWTGLAVRFRVVGDYAATIRYRLLTWPTPPEDPSSINLGLNEGASPQRIWLTRRSDRIGGSVRDRYEVREYYGGPSEYNVVHYSPASGSAGQFTIERESSTTRVFANGVLLWQGQWNTEPCTVGCFAGRWRTGSPVHVAYDDFEISADGAELYVEQPETPLWDNIDEYDAVYVVNGGSIVVPEAEWGGSTWIGGYLMLEADTIYVDSNSSIHADSCGFHEDDGLSDGGPGAGQDLFHAGGASALKSADGAGYGGRGGHYWTTVGPGGVPYGQDYEGQDDTRVDWLFGSQGGDLRWQQWPHIDEFGPGGRGGGYVRLRGSTVMVEGTVTANGGNGQPITIAPNTFGGGGGSGGQIVLDSPNLTVTGTVEASGGDGSYPTSDYSGGGGAGGRIKILQPSSDICGGTFSVGGGSGCGGMGNGQAGTIYLPDTPPSDAPTISGLTEDTGRDPSDLITKDPRISGNAEPGGIVRLYAEGNLVGSGGADGSTGAFSVSANGAVDGMVEVAATAQGPCHSESAPSDPFTFTYDTDPPGAPFAPDLHPSSDAGRFINDDITNDSTPLMQGTCEPDMDIVLYEGSTELATGWTLDGNWEVTSISLGEGTHQLTATATDAAGNESAPSNALSILVDLTDPTITNPSISPTECEPIGTEFDLSMTATDALSGVTSAWNPQAYIHGNMENYTVILDPAGGSTYQDTWSSSGANEGTYDVDFKAWDLAGNIEILADAASICLFEVVPGDLDEDGDVDLDDFSIFAGCVAGPDVTTPPPGCDPAQFGNADLDGSASVDLQDFGDFQEVFSGPG